MVFPKKKHRRSKLGTRWSRVTFKRFKPRVGDLVMLLSETERSRDHIVGTVIEVDYVGTRYGPESYRVLYFNPTLNRLEIMTWLGWRGVEIIQRATKQGSRE